MKRIKLFFLAFLGVCLGLTSFSSALQNSFFRFGLVDSNDNFIDNDNFSTYFVPGDTYRLGYEVGYYDSSLRKNVWPIQSVVSSNSNWNLPRYKLGGMSDMFFDDGGSIVIHGNNCFYNSLNVLSGSYDNALGVTVNYPNYWGATFASGFVIDSSNYRNYSDFAVFTNSCDFSINTTQDMQFWSVGFLFEFYNDTIFFAVLNNNYTAFSGSSVDCSQDSNYRQCLEDKNQLIGQVSTLSGSLTSCQSDLSDCRGGQDASLLACIDQKEQCENSLITLSGNYASLENMNSSLSSQLQECLESSSNLTGDLICNKFDLFWSSDNTDYSFPINNDLILPPGYKGFVNEGVLAIKPDSSLDSAYSIDDEEFQDVIDSYGVVFLYMFGSSLFLVFLYMIRKYFIGLKS